MLIICR